MAIELARVRITIGSNLFNRMIWISWFVDSIGRVARKQVRVAELDTLRKHDSPGYGGPSRRRCLRSASDNSAFDAT
jgi:hypothetical protein